MLAGIDGFSTGGSDDMYSLKMVSDKVRWYLKGVTAGVDSTDTLTNYAAATADGWVHVVGVYEPGVSSRLYINGALDNTGSGGGAISNFPDPFGMGRYYNNLRGVLDGALDDVQVYNLALSDADVSFLHANPGSIIGEATAPFAITEIEYDPDAGTVTLTWRKTGAASYIAQYSIDMTNWEGDMGDEINEDMDENTGDADHITLTFTLSQSGIDEETELYFRIMEEE